MNESRHCPRCNARIAPDAPEKLCPRCLVAGGLNTADAQIVPTNAEAMHASPGDFVPPTVEEIGRRFPQLEVLEFIGRGGMSAVYKARQPHLDRIVALKVLPAALGSVPGFADRFAREAQALARLNHPNIVAVHDFGRSDGLFYFIMEYVDGPNLRQVIHSGMLAPAQVLTIIPKICEALQFAHDHGVVHRDIKPENILVGGKGQVKIADFGLAKLLARDLPRPALTATGQVMGTPQYMAPEQVEHPHDVDHRADIYSLGVVFYELLTGELPLGRFAPPSAKVHIDLRLDEVVLKALEKEPERRYQNANELKSRVENVASRPPGAGAAVMGAPRAPLDDGGGVRAASASIGAEGPRGMPAEAPRLCVLPLWGLLWAVFFVAPFFVFLGVHVAPASAETPPETTLGQTIGMVVAIGLAIIGTAAPFGTTAFGCMAIGRIRVSAGRLYGMVLAVFVALLFPIMIADGLLIGLFFTGYRNTDLWNIVLLVWILLVVALDWLVIRAVWRAVHRSQ